jgi:hypothetical protein
MVAPVSPAAERFSTHAEPVWRDRANFIINAPLPEAGRFEQLWTRKVGDRQFEICCIPFFLYDLALGDTVETAPQGGRQYVLSRVLNRSGRYVFRAYFERPQYRYRDAAVEALESLGAQIEWSSPSLLAVDVVGSSAQKVADAMHDLEKQGRLVFETGKTA